MSSAEKQCAILAFTMGGGLAFMVEGDHIAVYQLEPGMSENEPSQPIGIVTQGHMALVAEQLTEAVGRVPDRFREAVGLKNKTVTPAMNQLAYHLEMVIWDDMPEGAKMNAAEIERRMLSATPDQLTRAKERLMNANG